MERGVEDGQVRVTLVRVVREALQDDTVDQVWYAGIELAGWVGPVVFIELQPS